MPSFLVGSAQEDAHAHFEPRKAEDTSQHEVKASSKETFLGDIDGQSVATIAEADVVKEAIAPICPAPSLIDAERPLGVRRARDVEIFGMATSGKLFRVMIFSVVQFDMVDGGRFVSGRRQRQQQRPPQRSVKGEGASETKHD